MPPCLFFFYYFHLNIFFFSFPLHPVIPTSLCVLLSTSRVFPLPSTFFGFVYKYMGPLAGTVDSLYHTVTGRRGGPMRPILSTRS